MNTCKCKCRSKSRPQPLVLPELQPTGGQHLSAENELALFRLLEYLPISEAQLLNVKWQLQAFLKAARVTPTAEQDSPQHAYAWLVKAVRSKDAASVLAVLKRKLHLDLPD